MSSQPRVYIVVLNWNNYPDSQRCLNSLRQVAYDNLRVIIVDNASRDGSGVRLQNEYPDHLVVFNTVNLGFARGCNVGIRRALADAECAFVLLLNNDAELAPESIGHAIDSMNSDPTIGAASGKILVDRERIWYAGGTINRWLGRSVTRGFGEIDYGQYDRIEAVRFVTGALMLIPRRTLEKVGLLPEEYFFGFEEYDYSLRLHRSGYKLLYIPGFLAFHLGGGSNYCWEPKYIYNSFRNKLILWEKYLPFGFFRLWVRVYWIYMRWFAKRNRKRWTKKYSFAGVTPPRKELFDYALDQALLDHRSPLAEDSLKSFEARWKTYSTSILVADGMG